MASPQRSHDSETSPLLSDRHNPVDSDQDVSSSNETTLGGAGEDGKTQTNWVLETKLLAKYSRSSIVTFLLQYSLNVASIVAVGHLGKIELGAASLGYVTANITGYAIYTGLGKTLDPLLDVNEYSQAKSSHLI